MKAGASAVVCPTVAEREAAEQRPEGLGLFTFVRWYVSVMAGSLE